ncbi:MAG: ParB/RepB/Spo0J family partition protein [Planctomycetaceae bacterium]|nr:ParB/RepB/Spo0J family partition protein [Planctomycetaceae bacterium]
MGVRQHDARPQLSPIPTARDVGRRALRNFGTLSIDNVIPDPAQPRIEFAEEEIEQLAQSIREKGQLHPIRVRWSDEHGKWIIISGERRFRATKRAGLQSIECHFHDGELSKSQILEQQLIENLLRADLRPLEEAKAFQQLLDINGWTGKELSAAIHVTPSRITRALSLLRLPPDIQAQVESGELSPSVAYEISKLSSDEQQREALARRQTDGLTRDQLAETVRKRKPRQDSASRGVKQIFTTETGWKVTVTAPHQGTYDEIEQALQDALDEVRLRINSGLRLF